MAKRTTDTVPDGRLERFEADLAAKGYRPRGWLDVLDSCDFHDRKTNQKVALDRNRLRKIADHRNHLVLSRQSVSHYSLGHTKDDAPEWEQPPLVGLASRWRVGSYADGTPNLEAYSWERPGHEGVFDEYPQRSAELFLNPDDINPIALLKSTTPRRDLSLRLSARYADAPRFVRAGSRRPILFQLRTDTMNEDTTTTGPGDELLSRLFASDEWKALCGKVEAMATDLEKIKPVFEEIEQEAMSGEGDEAPAASPVTRPAPAAPAKPEPAKEDPASKNARGAVPVRFAARQIVADPVLASRRLPDDYDALVRLAGRPDARALVS